MNISSNGQRKLNNSFAENENEVKRYLRIAKKRKWVIIITFLTVFFGWLGYVIVFGSSPTYSATALLHFQNSGEDLAIGGEGGSKTNESKATWLETNRLIGQVVEELQLNLSMATENVSREHFFNYADVNSESVGGIYRVVPGAEKYDLMYFLKSEEDPGEILLSFLPEDTVQINNITFQVNQEYIENSPHETISFKVRNADLAIKTLKSRISYGWLDRKTKNNLKITATDKSPNRAAQITNVIADKFVYFDSYVKNLKNYETLENLDKQLEVAKVDLDNSNRQLQMFRERNPTVQDVNTTATITADEQSKNSIQLRIDDLNRLATKAAASADFEDKIDYHKELVSYLIAEGIPSATVFDAEFIALKQKRDELMTRYRNNSKHPNVQANTAQFAPLFPKITSANAELINKLQSQISSLNTKISRVRRNLATLPEKQRRLSELVVDQGVKSQLYESLLSKFNQAKIKTEVEVGDVFVFDKATVPPLQSSSGLIIQKSLLGLLIGLGLGIALAIVLEFFDKTVQTAEDLESKLKLPVIGTIPVIQGGEDMPENIKDIKGKRDTKLITLDYSPTLESESYRDIRTKLLFMNQNRNLSSFLLTSLRPSEGKSLTSSNLAITFAQQKISTLLIDADLRRGVLHNVYGNKKKPGLGDFLISKATVDYENVNKLIQKTIIPNLYLITTGSPIPNPTEMLGSERMINLLNVLKSRFGMVILDTAPFQASSDSAILSSAVGGVVVVVRADYTNIEQLNQKIHEYPNIQENILGLVLNMVKMDMKKERYQYSYYNY